MAIASAYASLRVEIALFTPPDIPRLLLHDYPVMR
jgi:hypothetical protein